jgi:hypothetical protein
MRRRDLPALIAETLLEPEQFADENAFAVHEPTGVSLAKDRQSSERTVGTHPTRP